MRFAYRPYEIVPSPADPSPYGFRPELLVRVDGSREPTNDVPIWGILDPAAVDCILPYEVADRVNPVWSPGTWPMTDYAGGIHQVEYGRVYLQFQIGKKRLRWPTIVAFSRDRRTALWGRSGFLDHFNVTFHGPEKYFIIRLRGRLPTGLEADSTSPPRDRRRDSKRSDLITPGEQNP
jgi:hypothetical protein